jgi:hypothetical protein
MSQQTYSIPTGPNARFDYQRNLVTRCIAGATAWLIAALKLTTLAPFRTAYELAFVASSNAGNQSPSLTAARDAAWLLYEPYLVDLLDHNILHNAAISAADLKALFIHISGGTSTAPAPAPTTSPIVSLNAEEVSVLHVSYADAPTPSVHSKPNNVAFCELVYKIDVPAPASPADCPERANIARSHEPIVFEPLQRGKQVSAFARWVNKNGKQGPWSGVVTAFVP